jgi:glycosyltransferase involved in cell wall biosynthesis
MENCLIVTSLNYPENRGISQLAEKLTRRGLHPIVISLPPDAADRQVVTIATLAPFYSKKSRLLRILFAKNSWWNPLLVSVILAAAKKYRPSCIFVREPNFLLAPIIVARILKIDLYLDIRENPEIQFISNKGAKVSRRILSGPTCIKRFLLMRAFKLVRHVFCVSQELRDLIAREYGLPLKYTSVLTNYPSRQFLKKSFEVNRAILKLDESSLKLVHAGGVSEDTGLQDILPAVARLKELGYKCVLTIVGNGNYIEHLRKQSSEMDIEERVIFLPAVEPLDLSELLAQHDAGVCANRVNENSIVTIPGKLFEYMAAGLAIFSNARPTVVRIINEAQCGVVYDSYDTKIIAEQLVSMASDSIRVKELGKKARAYLKAKTEGEQYDLPNWVGNRSGREGALMKAPVF